MAEPHTYLLLGNPSDDYKSGHDASWTLITARSPEEAVGKWTGERAGEDEEWVVYIIEGADRSIVRGYARWEVAHK